ncbi:cation diffusion facilitator family transporter [Niallia sp. 03091]|uniref:cation diffusion facilitator family transporter n=1 Tax=unclassified Niallia TaxID=2837522 RepID=UPI0040444593
MGHNHGHHHHGHEHHHSHTENKKALFLSFILITSFMIVEVVGGILTNSLALLSDAGHMLSDAFALGLSFFAMKLGERKATERKTYGYKRFEIIAAALNGLTLMAISVYIFVEAYQRFFHPQEVQSKGMLMISITGLLINIAAAFLLMKGDKNENLNVRSAFLHVIGDMLGSVGAIAAALFILFFGWEIADPIASIVVAILILISGFRITKESFHILMEGTPNQINLGNVKASLLNIPNVQSVHDLHLWSITSDMSLFSCHIVLAKDGVHDHVLSEAQIILHDQYGIEHSTVQVESAKNGCPNHHGCCN